MINPVLNAAMLTSLKALHAANLITDPVTKEALVGAVMAANAICAAHTYEQVAAEMNHILMEGPVVSGPYTTPGYTKEAFAAALVSET